ncbi:hypothetical protein HBH56_006730 [Parastagonospora nodorum]|uniref:Uncharacterized protein n=2 Tax=Phaeosphaeria nodorum (strain SN15 / ATCC MYA-4574 / FGSC 10173) TaxID=321614 RepID=Q0V7K4_PHANO|nr:hypothetical protein SNOG_00010 [Parastagonospora nodorum SN15]KAH3920589.1 hypothetical protein HBH56_006730 [Parastagonospora nodorum]EAT91505.1 hypothetical protein SNOG_00010 [Parastagonospora nodorum SN15]KAH3937769.1 hypothetical protein HBH54_006720 [Parastagonospora nodorum]KAH4109114.1 hypothetical protein HBH46_032320 [Parastagonospora nodorum]KAH4145412.1 hypothetical protein HBH45_005690 [Parastagonospora nodorum]
MATTDVQKSYRLSLNDLPTELLEHIVSSIDLNRSDRVLGHIPDDPPPNQPDPYLIRDFLASCAPLCSLSLASRRFRDIAQKHIFTAPVLGGFAFRFPNDLSHARVAYFLRTIFARPDFRRYVKQIRLCFPRSGEPADQRSDPEESNLKALPLNLVIQVVCPSRNFIEALNLPADIKEAWRSSMNLDYRYALLRILRVLLPQIERFSLSEVSSDAWLYAQDRVLNVDGIDGLNMNAKMGLPCARNLKFLKLSSLTPIRLDGLNVFPNLDTLDISIKLAGLDNHEVQHLSRLYGGSDALETFRSIRHLRLDCQIKTVGIWDFSARSGMTHILQAFPKLASLDFYAEASSEKNPFRSVRAFPHYQANIQTYPEAPLLSDYDASTGDTYWDERLYAARTEWTDYQYLVDSLVHVRPHLQFLRLPGGFWTLPGATRKPLPRFELFSQLRRLALPQAAILSTKLFNMRHPETVVGDFNLTPIDVLPPGLKYLEIFDADSELLQSRWMQVLFEEHSAGGRWPDLQEMEFLFGPPFSDEELQNLLAKSSWTEFWTLASRAAFQVHCKRDDKTPMVDM